MSINNKDLLIMRSLPVCIPGKETEAIKLLVKGLERNHDRIKKAILKFIKQGITIPNYIRRLTEAEEKLVNEAIDMSINPTRREEYVKWSKESTEEEKVLVKYMIFLQGLFYECKEMGTGEKL